jgi:hypothetical protein
MVDMTMKADGISNKGKRNVESGIVRPCRNGRSAARVSSGFVPTGTFAARAPAGKRVSMRITAKAAHQGLTICHHFLLARRIGSITGRLPATSGFLKRKL